MGDMNEKIAGVGLNFENESVIVRVFVVLHSFGCTGMHSSSKQAAAGSRVFSK